MGLLGGFDRNDRRLGMNFAAMFLRDRFLGTGLGLFWAVLQPAAMIGVYVYVFSFLFKSRLPGLENSEYAFAIYLISGFGPWLAINEGMMSGTNAVVGQSSLVKNMAFKTELLPMAAAVLGLVPLLVSIAGLSVLITLDGRMPAPVWLIMIPYLFFMYLFVAGLGLMLGAANVFVRDISLALPTVMTMLLFLSPIFYSIETFPEGMRDVVKWNPFYVIANGFRAPIVDGKLPPWPQTLYLAVLSFAVYWLGLIVFRRMKSYFHGRL
jgi:lipopolysaccharide transport system permease protein